jgi:hypothetical protein
MAGNHVQAVTPILKIFTGSMQKYAHLQEVQ